MKKKAVKKLVLSKETVALTSATVVGGAITDNCNTFRCPPTDPVICQSGRYPC
ncbi:MAG: hypothetical protein QOJ16_3267 [Acidobacteriota bacterium]|jgi:hypothetical protein|nr:hypothetical protein [Acidobacteriota bacterium]